MLGPRPRPDAPSPTRARLVLLAGRTAAAALGVAVGALVVALSFAKRYGVDEFGYAHASWLVSRGEVPYRDFFEHHFPLAYQLGAAAFLVGGGDPEAIARLRLMMLLFAGLTGWALWRLASRDARRPPDAGPASPAVEGGAAGSFDWAALMAPAFAFSVPSFASSAVEIRPDPLAFALFAASLALVSRDGATSSRPGARAAAAGALLALAVWGTQKALVYGLPFALAFVLDLAVNRRGARRELLASAPHFVLGFGGVAAAVAVYLASTGSWSAFVRYAVLWPVEFQRAGEGFSWRQHFAIVKEAPWLVPLFAAGLADAVLAVKRAGRRCLSHPDLLVAASLAAALASYLVQPAPYEYSLVPFTALACLFAGRGASLALRELPRLERRWVPAGWIAVVLLALALGRHFSASAVSLAGRTAPGNREQHEALAVLRRLTSPDDPVYDDTGSYVARPHSRFQWYTSAYMRRHAGDELARGVPGAIEERGVTVRVVDERSRALPGELAAYLGRHFVPFDGDFHLWGMRLDSRGPGPFEAEFLAVREDEYFVEPASAIESAGLTIDGARPPSDVVRLSMGVHRLTWERPAAPFHVLWLPASGERWRPTPRARARLWSRPE